MKGRPVVCHHLKELYQLCESNQIRIGSSDLVRITCRKCDEVETCPSVLMDEYDAHDAGHEESTDSTAADSTATEQ